MPRFAYEALTSSGAVTRGDMPAASEAELEERLRSQGSYLIRAEVKRAEKERSRTTDGRVDRREMLGLTEYIAASTQAGIPILSTLEDAAARMQTKRMKRIVLEVRDSMANEGRSLSESLAEHPKAFSQLYITTVAAGEASGHLDYALNQLVDYLDWQQEIRSQFIQATVYPAIVLVGMIGLVSILVGFVFPRLFPVLSSFDVELPWATQVIITVATFIQSHWVAMAVGLVAAVVAFFLVRQTERGRLWTDRALLWIPVFGPLVHRINMARLVTYMALFYRTGVELLHGLQLVEDMMENRVVARAVGNARRAVAHGESMASAFGASSLFPTVVVRSIALGESTGSLDDALGRAKQYYDRDVPAAVKRMLTALQPILVVIMGGIIIIVALAIFLPILTIYQSLGR